MIIKLFFFIINYMFSVGFFMYIERKVLGLGHYREGPNKILFKGYIQFIMDMIKLLFKDFLELYYCVLFSYFFIPIFLFINMFFLWVIMFYYSDMFNKEISLVYLMVLMILKMLYLVMMVFFICSSYSIMSMTRMVIQLVSYDIVVILFILVNFIIYVDFSIELYFNNYYNYIFLNFVLLFFWVVSLMVELIRLPFDFYEGESELVSGFNIEYGFMLFMFLVLVEYMEIIYFIVFTIIVFTFFIYWSLFFNFFLLVMVFFFIWFRVYLVRYRMDKLLILLWKFIFPMFMVFVYLYYFINFF